MVEASVSFKNLLVRGNHYLLCFGKKTVVYYRFYVNWKRDRKKALSPLYLELIRSNNKTPEKGEYAMTNRVEN